jgi:hypothetical protein
VIVISLSSKSSNAALLLKNQRLPVYATFGFVLLDQSKHLRISGCVIVLLSVSDSVLPGTEYQLPPIFQRIWRGTRYKDSKHTVLHLTANLRLSYFGTGKDAIRNGKQDYNASADSQMLAVFISGASPYALKNWRQLVHPRYCRVLVRLFTYSKVTGLSAHTANIMNDFGK